MKPEIKDIAVELATKTAPAGGLTLVSAHWWVNVNWTGVMTGVLILLQIAYLLRKWWREETSWGRRLRKLTQSDRPASTKDDEADE